MAGCKLEKLKCDNLCPDSLMKLPEIWWVLKSIKTFYNSLISVFVLLFFILKMNNILLKQLIAHQNYENNWCMNNFQGFEEVSQFLWSAVIIYKDNEAMTKCEWNSIRWNNEDKRKRERERERGRFDMS